MRFFSLMQDGCSNFSLTPRPMSRGRKETISSYASLKSKDTVPRIYTSHPHRGVYLDRKFLSHLMDQNCVSHPFLSQLLWPGTLGSFQSTGWDQAYSDHVSKRLTKEEERG